MIQTWLPNCSMIICFLRNVQYVNSKHVEFFKDYQILIHILYHILGFLQQKKTKFIMETMSESLSLMAFLGQQTSGSM